MVEFIFFIHAAVHAGSFIQSQNPACTAAWNFWLPLLRWIL